MTAKCHVKNKSSVQFYFYNRALGFRPSCVGVVSFFHQYCGLSFSPSCTYPADNPEPCEGQQLTSTAVVIDHDVTTTAIGVAAAYLGQEKKRELTTPSAGWLL